MGQSTILSQIGGFSIETHDLINELRASPDTLSSIITEELFEEETEGEDWLQPVDFGDEDLEMEISESVIEVQGERVVVTDELRAHVETLSTHISHTETPILISGTRCSGKATLMKLLAHLFKMEDKIIQVEIDESTDVKGLVGSYVCNESGEFSYQKGPLSLAAELGYWLVFKSIDKAAGDLVSYLIPAIER